MAVGCDYHHGFVEDLTLAFGSGPCWARMTGFNMGIPNIHGATDGD